MWDQSISLTMEWSVFPFHNSSLQKKRKEWVEGKGGSCECLHCASHNHVDRMSCLIVVSVIRVISIPRSP